MQALRSVPAKAPDAAVATLLRRRDLDLYWSALFAPQAARSHLHALYAFHTELRRIPLLTTEPMVGQIRLQWWRDAIDLATPETKTGNPIADGLSAAIFARGLSKEPLNAMIDARIGDLYKETPANMAGLHGYLDATEGTMFETASIIAGEAAEASQTAARQAGRAFGLMRILNSLPQQVARRHLMVPAELLQSRKIDLARLYQGDVPSAFTILAARLRTEAFENRKLAAASSAQLQKGGVIAFLPLAPVVLYLKKLEKLGVNTLKQQVTVSPPARFLRIWRAARRGKI